MKQVSIYKPPFHIKHKTGWLAACNFHSLYRVKNWLDRFNPEMYVVKTLKKKDFIILNRDGERVG